ncbi:hypothetical protein BCR32DRAFT_247470 [Anaeromyces robustus]|uniref:Uncharacterized protein n=1 Tax=Anaeromyces robustus TaxID=1754192 RepID=A0A1Y1WXJ9_9FUNG|nr:hypothetical protein BCR32DRAFT_247470 [Anaeromyces robustus]|eukprot:ORX78048.1 hypothetical protein BCR32DRAFT_247470 [Anaeromyces robustus]
MINKIIILNIIIIGLLIKKTFQQEIQINYNYNNITSFQYYKDFVYLYNNDTVRSKEEILKYTDIYHTGYYCKNNICVHTDDNEYFRHFIEFPDNNEHIKLYITTTFPYEYIKEDNYFNKFCTSRYEDIECCVSVQCEYDSQCLSNKCMNNHCIFNDNNPIEHCDSIYSYNQFLDRRTSYIHCGKPYLDSCENNDECSSKKCAENKICLMQLDGPSDSEGLIMKVYVGSAMFVIIIITIICLVVKCRYEEFKKKQVRY